MPTAVAMKKAVETHFTCFTLTPNEVMMLGRATLTMEDSSRAMNGPIITTAMISQRRSVVIVSADSTAQSFPLCRGLSSRAGTAPSSVASARYMKASWKASVLALTATCRSSIAVATEPDSTGA